MSSELLPFTLWLSILTLALAAGAAFWVDYRTVRARLDPPGFSHPLRRALALSVLVFVFWIGVFGPLLSLGAAPEINIEELNIGSVFLVQGLLLSCLALWYALGLGGVPGVTLGDAGARLRRELGLGPVDFKKELGVGLVAGIFAWGLVLSAAMALAAVLFALGAGDWLEQDSPAAIAWLAALPVAFRLLISLTAGVVEEIFFRGFLQKRIGLVAATVLFVAGHAGYGQPFMLFGITLLSLFYGLLARWRGNVWAAMVAHALFDAVQLLVFIPIALEAQGSGVAENFVATLEI